MTGSRFITPPSEQEEHYPYRRVWLSIATEMIILAVLVIAVFVLTRLVTIPDEFRQPVDLLIALVPPALWIVFSWWRERRAELPRYNLIAVAIISALAANAIGIPVIDNVFTVDRWLPLGSAIDRIVGYTFTIGTVQTLIVYLVLRYVVWPQSFRIRLDGVAYGASSAVGYAAVLNLQSSFTSAAPPFVSAMQTFNQQAIMLCVGIIVGYGLSEVRFNIQPFPLILALALALASLVTGIAIPLIAGFASASISPEQPVGVATPIQGFLFAAAMLVGVIAIFNFLFAAAERQAPETEVEDVENLRI